MRLKNLKNWIAWGAVVVLIVLIVCFNLFKQQSHTKNVFALNTYVSVTVYGRGAEAHAIAAIKHVTDAEKIFSAHDENSELYKLNTTHSVGVPFPVSDELFGVIKTALALSEKTNGKFDITIKPVSDAWSITQHPTVPSVEVLNAALEKVDYKSIVLNDKEKTVTFSKEGMQIDLGGIAKGYIAEQLASHLKANGAEGAIIDLGGNIVVFGKHRNGFRIGIQTPWKDTGTFTAILKAPENAITTIVTSGAYERNFEKNGVIYHHIIDPVSGYPHNGEIDSVSVIGTFSTQADALSTYLFMLPPHEALDFAKSEGFDVFIQTKDKKIYTTLERSAYEITDKSFILN